jgi:hypothetical protein
MRSGTALEDDRLGCWCTGVPTAPETWDDEKPFSSPSEARVEFSDIVTGCFLFEDRDDNGTHKGLEDFRFDNAETSGYGQG